MKIAQLQHPFLTPAIQQELVTKNVIYVSSFLAHNPGLLSTKCSLSMEQIFILRQYLIDNFAPYKVKSIVKDDEKTLADPVFQGALARREIFEAFGPPGGGKTQIAMFLTGLFASEGKKVLYMDTKNDFSVGRLGHFCQDKSCLTNVKLAKVFDMDQALKVTDELARQRSTKVVDFLVLDNIATIVWPLLGEDSLNDASSLVSRLVVNLRKIACWQNCAVFVVNCATNNGSKPALGKFFDAASKSRYHFAQMEDGSRVSVSCHKGPAARFEIAINRHGIARL